MLPTSIMCLRRETSGRILCVFCRSAASHAWNKVILPPGRSRISHQLTEEVRSGDHRIEYKRGTACRVWASVYIRWCPWTSGSEEAQVLAFRPCQGWSFEHSARFLNRVVESAVDFPKGTMNHMNRQFSPFVLTVGRKVVGQCDDGMAVRTTRPGRGRARKKGNVRCEMGIASE